MDLTVFLTVVSGVLTYIIGQLVLKLVIEPVQELRKTIGLISHALIEHANVFSNPVGGEMEALHKTSSSLRSLSSQLQSHLYLMPKYYLTAYIFRLPSHKQIRDASSALIGLSNSIFRPSPGENFYKVNAKRVETICDSLGIYLPDESRWSEVVK